MLRRLLLAYALISIVGAAAMIYSPSVARASSPCQDIYAGLYGSFEWSKSGHVALAQQGDGNAVQGTAQQQWALAYRYDLRELAAWYVANGDDTYLDWLLYDLEDGRRAHQAWVEWLTANPYSPINYTADNVDFQRWAVGLYDWRIAETQRLAEVC